LFAENSGRSKRGEEEGAVDVKKIKKKLRPPLTSSSPICSYYEEGECFSH
jgi:hypothetical protein